MIKHIVMWNVRGDTADEKRETAEIVKRAFESLIGEIPGLLTLEIGIDISRISYACDVVLYSEFESKDALQAYGITRPIIAPRPNSKACVSPGIRSITRRKSYLLKRAPGDRG